MPAGVRSAQCAVFHAQPRGIEPPQNDTVGRDRAWVEDPPAKVPYKSLYNDGTKEEQGVGTYIFIALCCIFIAAIVSYSYEVFQSARRDHKLRRERASKTGSGSPSQRWQPAYTDSVIPSSATKAVGFKPVNEDEKRSDGTYKSLPKDYKSIPTSDLENDSGNDTEMYFNGQY